MTRYLLKRLMLVLPTLVGVTTICFGIINLAPGSPVEQKLQAIRLGGAMGGHGGHADTGVSQEVIDTLNRQYGFDKPLAERYWIWVKGFAAFDFGKSFKYEEPVLEVISSRLGVTMTFGGISLFLIYLICVPLGVLKAIRAGSSFDLLSSLFLFFSMSVPTIILAVGLVVFFAGGSFLNWFPTGGVTSDNYEHLTLWAQVVDRLRHMVLPLICYVAGGLALTAMVMKNSMLDAVSQDYVRTARAKGLSEKLMVLSHALRNSLLPIGTGFSTLLSSYFAGSIIIERIFQLDGLGLLALTAVNSRDYNLLMGLIVFESLLFISGRLLSDLFYLWIDPRVSFE